MRVCIDRFSKALEQNAVAVKEAVAIFESSGFCLQDLQKIRAILKADEDNRLGSSSGQRTGEYDRS